MCARVLEYDVNIMLLYKLLKCLRVMGNLISKVGHEFLLKCLSSENTGLSKHSQKYVG